MAGSDPKKTRDPGREDYDADEDPLVELARIVSEDGGFSGRMAQRPRVEPMKPTVDRNAFSSDLEAELLQELETSFSARGAPSAESERFAARDAREQYVEPEPEPESYAPQDQQYAAEPEPEYAPEPPAEAEEEPVYPAPLASRGRRFAEQPQPAPRVEDPDDLLRSIEEQLSQFEERVRSDGLSLNARARADDETRWQNRRGEERLDVAPEPRDEWQDAPGMAASRPEYSFRGPAAANWDRPDEREEETAAEEEPYEPQPQPQFEPDDEPVIDLFRRRVAPQPEPAEDYADEVEEELDPFATPEAEIEEAPMSLDEPAVYPVARDFASLEEELSAELDSAYRPQDVVPRREAPQEPEDEREFAPVAAIVPGAGMRPPPQEGRAPAARRRRSGRGFVMAAAIVIVVVVGGVGALYYRSLEQGPSGPPPVIAAPDGPVKIEPAEQADAGEETVGEAVFNRVAGNATETEETVVEGAEEPREIARIVQPEPEGTGEEAMMEETAADDGAMSGEATMADGASSATEAEGSGEDFGPRRVPTYVVRADGTIVATAETGEAAGAADLSEQQMAIAQTEAMEPTPVDTVPIEQPRTAGTPGVSSSGGSGPSMAVEQSGSDANAAPAGTETAMAMDAESEAAAIDAAEEPAGAAAEILEEEIEVAAVEPVQVPQTTASGFVVQLSAQTSQADAEATFANLQRRYPSILGSLEPNIQRADLDKGTYYRVRVGPWAERSQAIEVCEALKAAGADCYVAR